MKKLLTLIILASNGALVANAAAVYSQEMVNHLIEATILDEFISAVQANPSI